MVNNLINVKKNQVPPIDLDLLLFGEFASKFLRDNLVDDLV